MKGYIKEVFRNFLLIISCTCILTTTACQQENNPNDVNVNPENSESSPEARSFSSFLSSWTEVGLLDDVQTLERLYVWSGLLFVEYISKEIECFFDDVSSICENKRVVIKQVAPGQWEERDLTDAYIADESTVDILPENSPAPVLATTQFTIEGRCIITLVSDDGIYFFEDGFGWKEWSEGIQGYEILDIDYVPEEKILYAVTQDELYRLDLNGIEALAEEMQVPTSERLCKETNVTIEF